MWDKWINRFIIDYYMDFYAPKERQMYLPDLTHLSSIDNCVIGGEIGLKYLLGDEPLATDSCIVFTRTLVDTARELTDLIYMRTEIPLTVAKTSVPNREINITVSGRQVTSVYPISTTLREAVRKRVQYWNGIERKMADVEFKLVSPYLYMIEYLGQYIDPLYIGDRESIETMLNKLAQKIEWPDIPIANLSHMVARIKNAEFLKYMNDRLFVYITETSAHRNQKTRDSEFNIYIITKLPFDDELEVLADLGCDKPRIHNIQLPGLLFFPKITTKFKRGAIIYHLHIYTIASHRLVSFEYLAAANNFDAAADDNSSASNTLRRCTNGWQLYILMIEDNSGLDLVFNEHFSHYTRLVSIKMLKAEFEDFAPDRIYGIYVDPMIVKKKYIANAERIAPYYPIIKELRATGAE
jgi:hypothetical protein